MPYSANGMSACFVKVAVGPRLISTPGRVCQQSRLHCWKGIHSTDGKVEVTSVATTTPVSGRTSQGSGGGGLREQMAGRTGRAQSKAVLRWRCPAPKVAHLARGSSFMCEFRRHHTAGNSQFHHCSFSLPTMALCLLPVAATLTVSIAPSSALTTHLWLEFPWPLSS